MAVAQKKGDRTRPVQVALKNLHCFLCGGVIPKGETYVRKEFVKAHYKLCPPEKNA